MPTKFDVVLLVALVFICVLVGVGVASSRAQQQPQPKSYAPYEIGVLPDGSHVYKMNDQGCEIYVVENLHGQMQRSDSIAVGIATGRGCK